jgi:predicted amidohydrolase
MKKKKRPIISLAQIRYYDTPEKHNVVKIKKYISLAKKAGSDIVCFPETCIHKTDYMSFSHKLIKDIQKACKENSIWAIVTDSFLINRKPYKIALLIDRKGKIKGRYKKINLYDDDTEAGKRIFTYKTDFAKIGIVICWDLAHPDLFKKMKEAGAEIVFCPSKWCYEDKAYKKNQNANEKELLKALVKARAFENLFFVALVNPLIKKGHKDLISYSLIAAPHKTLKDIEKKEGLISTAINIDEIARFSRIYNKSS